MDHFLLSRLLFCRVPYGDNVTTQAFPLTVTVSFVFKGSQDFLGYSPPPPPVLFKVPYDVFYPFYASSASPQYASTSSQYSFLSILIPPIALVVLFLVSSPSFVPL
jgi:hypothetical protein